MNSELMVMYATLAIYNLAATKLLSIVLKHSDMRSAVQEKDVSVKVQALTGYTGVPAGQTTEETSYSRVVGLIGGAVMVAFFWAVGNVVLYKAFLAPAEVASFVASLAGYFLAGATLFLPYAANQLRAAFTSK